MERKMNNVATSNHDVLALLQQSVETRLNSWDAERALELALSNGEETDRKSELINDYISSLAAGLNAPADVQQKVSQEHLNLLMKEIGLKA
jgi:hypothetical protein